jgi:enoyl-[acyl-carrier-protein] reductase (NADH)
LTDFFDVNKSDAQLADARKMPAKVDEVFPERVHRATETFIEMARLAAPMMPDSECMFAMTYYGAQKVVPNYDVMGPVKSALESVCKYLAYELGPKKAHVHAISPGPLKTCAASGLKDFNAGFHRWLERGLARIEWRRNNEVH